LRNICGGLNKSAGQDCEDADRKQLELPYNQNRVIEALAKVNKNLVYVNISGNAVAMPWVDDVPAILQAWFLGSESGTALASVIAGDVNPSGKLPFTFPMSLNDVPAHKLNAYPGVKRMDSQIMDEEYSEGIFVGYRWYEKEKIQPLFTFGHGLSYTQFKYGKVKLSNSQMTVDGKLKISVPVSNVGNRKGAEVVQLYISDLKSSLPRPVKELKDFNKVELNPGETKEINFTIEKDMLSFFDDTRHEWVVEPGKFEVLIGSSSSDIRGRVKFELQ
jgi:hypothetical protein